MTRWMTPEQRFFVKVPDRPPGECWLWPVRDGQRYGSFMVDGRTEPAHRWAYQHFIGPIPEGLESDHTCGVTRCVNPAHIEPKTHRANTLAHWREQRGWCRKRLHEMTPENSVLRIGGTIQHCRQCERDRKNAYRRRVTAARRASTSGS